MQTICFLSRIWRTCVPLKFLYFELRWSDGFFIFLQIFFQKFYLGSNKKLVPSNWLRFRSLLFEKCCHQATLFSFSVWHGSRSCVLLFSSCCLCIMKYSNNHTEHSFAFTIREILPVTTGVRSYIFFGWFVKLYWFYKPAFYWFRQASRPCSIRPWSRFFWAEFTQQILFCLPLFSGQSLVTSILHHNGHWSRASGHAGQSCVYQYQGMVSVYYLLLLVSNLTGCISIVL